MLRLPIVRAFGKACSESHVLDMLSKYGRGRRLLMCWVHALHGLLPGIGQNRIFCGMKVMSSADPGREGRVASSSMYTQDKLHAEKLSRPGSPRRFVLS